MNVFKWESVVSTLIEKSKILEKENNMDHDLMHVFITEMMFSKFGLKGNAKNILAIKQYKNEFLKIMKDNEFDKLSKSTPTKGTLNNFKALSYFLLYLYIHTIV